MIRVALALLLVHVVASDLLFLILRRLLRSFSRPSLLRTFLLTRGLGPVVVALLAYSQFLLFPGRSAAFQLTLLGTFFAGLLVAGYPAWGDLVSGYQGAWAWLRRRAARSGALVAVTVVLVVLGCLAGVGLPIVEHDALAAAIEARIALRDASFANYLAVDQPDARTGYYMETFRPPFLQSLYVALAWIGGPGYLDLLVRTTSPIFGLHLLLLVTRSVERHRSFRSADWAVFVLASTPILFYALYNNGIDTVRFYTMLVALLWIVELTATASRRVAVATGAAIGLALFCHPLSLPALAGGGLVFLLSADARWARRIAAGTVVVAVALITGAGYHYLVSPLITDKMEQMIETEPFQELRLAQAPVPPPDELYSGSGPGQPSRGPEPVLKPTFAESWSASAEEKSHEMEPTQERSPKPADPGRSSLKSAVEGPTVESPAAEAEPVEGRESLEKVTVAELSTKDPLPTPEPDQRPAVAGEVERAPGPAPLPQTAIDRHSALLEVRGQGRSPLQRLVFGRLQMFTGIEHFGWIFYLVWAGVVFWALRGPRHLLDRTLLMAAIFSVVVVLSGVRQLSWSNPRYIASVLPLGAFFAGPLLAAVEHRFLTARWCRALVVTTLLLPLLLVVAIRGVKVEITNPGDFYSDFRSLVWLEHTLERPAYALSTLWEDYLGIRRTVRYALVPQDEQLRQAHDYFAATLWIRDQLPPDAHVLVFRDARFFYYGERLGTVWYSPWIPQREYRFMETPEKLAEFFREIGITHVLVDDYSTRLSGYAERLAGPMLADEDLVELVYETGTARVYRLLPPGS